MASERGAASVHVPESAAYRLKTRLLGPPLVTERLTTEKLSKPLALGVLASDCISSSAYGSEEMLRILVPVAGTAAFTLLLPVTGAILLVLLLLTLSYRDVVSVYTRAGGSYVVARENFGPRVAQVAAVALLIDYVVTVAVQSSAGTDAVFSLLHLLGGHNLALNRWELPVTAAVVLLLCYGNLRGIREAGRTFAVPAYLFMSAVGLMLAVGGIRLLLGELPHAARQAGAVASGRGGHGLLLGASVFMLLRAFANGGSSLTGLEAISNGVSAFRRPQGRNARRTLVAMSTVLAVLVAGVSGFAYATRPVPYLSGSPTVLAQEAHLIFGGGWPGTAGLIFVQLSTALILYAGANTSFNGFPFLASFVAEDSFLPRQLTRRGHRLVFSNGIVLLTVVSLALLAATDANLDSLVALYAIGVFTGFVMATSGLVRHHWVRRERGRTLKLAVNGAAALASAAIVVIFAITKFTEGAWLVVVLFPIGVAALIRVNKQYRDEAEALAAVTAPKRRGGPRHSVVFVLVDSLDLAVVKALRYARRLRPDRIRAVHFMVDSAHTARLRRQWLDNDAAYLPLEVVECPDRRLKRAVVELAAATAAEPGTEVTLLIPERTYPRFLGRLLHRGTGNAIAKAVTRLEHVAATVVPFDVVAAHRDVLAGRSPTEYPRDEPDAPEEPDGPPGRG